MASSAAPSKPPIGSGLPVPFWRGPILWLTLYLAVALELHLNEIWPLGIHWERRANGGWALWVALLLPTLYLHIEGYPRPWHRPPSPPAASWWHAFWTRTPAVLSSALYFFTLHVAVPTPYHPLILPTSIGTPELRLVA